MNIESCGKRCRQIEGSDVPLVPGGNLKTDTKCRSGDGAGHITDGIRAAAREGIRGGCWVARNYVVTTSQLEPAKLSMVPAAWLRLDGRLIHQHDRNVVLHRIDPMTVGALQALRLLAILELLLAGWADQDFQQIFGDHDFALYDRAPDRCGATQYANPAIRGI